MDTAKQNPASGRQESLQLNAIASGPNQDSHSKSNGQAGTSETAAPKSSNKLRVKLQNDVDHAVVSSGMRDSNSNSRSDRQHQLQQIQRIIKLRSRSLTLCLFLLVGAISSLTPFLSLHLTNCVGLLLFESDLVQLRSSGITVIVCFVFLLVLDTTIVVLNCKRNVSCTGSGRNRNGASKKGADFPLFEKHKPQRLRESRSSMYLLQRILKLLVGCLALISILSYLGLALIVPHLRQIQRTPLATFDCSANLITIENCQQQFASLTGVDDPDDGLAPAATTIFNTIQHLIWTKLDNGNSERLANKLECLDYINHIYRDDEYYVSRRRVPTRFLLHKCGLVCKPQSDHAHQFNDDFNTNNNNHQLHRPLVAPYSQGDVFDAAAQSRHELDGRLVSLKLCFSGEINGDKSNYKRFCIENLTSGPAAATTTTTTNSSPLSSSNTQAHASSSSSTPSLSSGPPYSSQQDKTLTVNQLNAILSRVRVNEMAREQQQQQYASDRDFQTVIAPSLDQSTQYVNPVVQFESHFKNWPHVSSGANAFANDGRQQESTKNYHYNYKQAPDEQQWCKFKPIPPFIVNNKPFSDIQCSLEQDYFMSTGRQRPQTLSAIQSSSPLDSTILDDQSGQSHRRGRHRRNQEADNKIYLIKSVQSQGLQDDQYEQRDEAVRSERCNIQCKVDVLYQVQSQRRPANKQSSDNILIGARQSAASSVYYLPLKFCLFVLGDGDKAKTFSYYLICRSIADSSLLLAFMLIDILLLIESIDTKQFQLEGNKGRLFGLLLVITLIPLLVASLFDLAAPWLRAPNQDALSGPHSKSYRDGYLVSLFNEKLIPELSETLWRIYSFLGGSYDHSDKREKLSASSSSAVLPQYGREHSLKSPDSRNHTTKRPGSLSNQAVVVDNYLVPFFIYATFMFALAINVFRLPLIGLNTPLMRISSTEELGLVQKQADRRGSEAQQYSKQQGGRGISVNGKKGSENSSTPDISKLAASKQSLGESKSLQNSTEFETSSTTAKMAVTKAEDTPTAGNSVPDLAKTFSKSRADHSQFVAKEVAVFAILTLFMGLQFNLIQISQTQILLESFNIQNDLAQQQQYYGSHQTANNPRGQILVATWFVLVANSSGTIFVFLLAILFSDELSVFLAKFSPFKPLPSITSGSLSVRQSNELRFRKYLAISLVIYAMRYFVLANMSQASTMKWFLVVLFQVTELLNFPLVWFVLASRAHEFLGEVKNYDKTKRKPSNHEQDSAIDSRGNSYHDSDNKESMPESPTSSDTSMRLFSFHILVQSSLAFIYFALGRFLALFVFSFHASLYLHSNNVDWFISTFYNGKYQTASTVDASAATKAAKAGQQQQLNGTSSDAIGQKTMAASQPEALFAPLPSERQTYLHASRSLVKYNSLICLLLGTLFLAKFAHLRYKQWRNDRERQQAKEHQLRRAQTPQSDRESDLIDERISNDLKLVKARQTTRRPESCEPAAPTRITHVPKSPLARDKQRKRGDDWALNDEDKPRARIHFRYDLGLHENSSTNSSASSSSASATRPSSGAQALRQSGENYGEQGQPEESSTGKPLEFRIPIAFEDREEQQESGQQTSLVDKQIDDSRQSVARNVMHIERMERTRVKRVEIVKDGENWSLGSGSSDSANGAANRFDHLRRLPQQTSLDPMATSPPPPGFGDDDDNYAAELAGTSADGGGGEGDQWRGQRLSPRESDECEQQHLMGLLERRRTSAAQLKVPSEFATSHSTAAERNKRITFAPTTTLIDQDGGRSKRQFNAQALHKPIKSGQMRESDDVDEIEDRHHKPEQASGQRRHMASPECSIDDEDSEDKFGE